MTELEKAVTSVLTDRYAANATRVREQAAPLANAQFWQSLFRTETVSATWFCTSPAT